MVSKVFRLAASAVVLAAPGSLALAQTSPTSQESVEDLPVYLSADKLTDDRNEQLIIAEGNVEARFEDRVLRADKVIYDIRNETIRAQGNVQIIDSDGTVRYAEEIQVDESLDDGYALNFSTRLEGNAVATASSAIRKDGSINALEQMVYTACPVCADDTDQPTWALRARKAVQNRDTKMISYQDAILEVKGVPVFYIPYFAHPDPTTERRSGFLPPDVGVSSKRGVFYEQPYLWSISPSQDLIFKPQAMSKVNPSLGLDYRKRFFSGLLKIEGSVTHEQDFDTDGEKFGDDTWRSHLVADARFDVNPDWQWGLAVERQSDSLYDRRYDINDLYQQRGLYANQSLKLLSELFLVGQTDTMYSEVSFLSFQDLTTSNPATVPTVTPLIFAEKNLDFGVYGNLSVAGSSAVVRRDEGVSSARATVDVNWRKRSILGPGLVLEPFAELRGDAYDIEDTTGEYEEQSLTRGLGLAGAELSWPLMNSSGVFDIIVEPTIMAAWGTDSANDDGLPNEDALSFEADETTLFKPNGASNFDLWEGGARYSAGIKATANWGENSSISGMFGRRWREEADTNFTNVSNLAGTESDYVSSLSLALSDSLRFSTRMRFDESDFDVKRIDASAHVDLWRLQAKSRYFRLDKSLQDPIAIANRTAQTEEGIELKSRFHMNDRWSLIYDLDRNITEETNIRQQAGVAYEDDCSYFQLAYQRTESRIGDLGPSDSIQFMFALKTLGSLGDSQFD